MNPALVDRIAAAMLYEGYILYPYRPSLKNRQRWTFGGLYPPAYGKARGGSDASAMQTQCLVRGVPETAIDVRVRFLHLMDRTVGQLDRPSAELPGDEGWPIRPVAMLEVGDRRFSPWQEAVEREITLPTSDLGALIAGPRTQPSAFPHCRELEPLRDPSGLIVGVLVREQRAIEATVEVSAERVAEGVYRLTIEIRNETPLEGADDATRDDALMQSFVSTHAILVALGGEFLSLTDPPESLAGPSADCRNVGNWPILVGDDGETDTMLCAPIILEDYPRVAPESPGDLFDCSEIDEILTLRILTLTEDEKRQVAGLDERARALLERTEAIDRGRLLGLHGAVRRPRPAAGGFPS